MLSCQQENCLEIFETPESYISHLKKKHFLSVIGKFSCPNENCSQIFNQMKRFSKHLKNCFYKKFSQSENSLRKNRLDGSASILHRQIENIVEEDMEIIEDSQGDEKNAEQNEHSINQNFSSLITIIQEIVLKLSLQLHSVRNFTRKDVFNIQSYIINCLLKNMINIFNSFSSQNENCECGCKEHILKTLNFFVKSLEDISTDHLLTKKLEDMNLAKDLDDPRYEFTINKEVGISFKDGTSKFDETASTGMIMPLQFQIKEFLSRHNRLSEIFNNIKKFKYPSDTISHYFQGSTWKAIASYFSPETLIIPLGIYTDGMQFNNALGKHTDSSDMFYYFYPGLNDPLNRNNCHLASVIRSKFIKEYKNPKCLASLVKVLYSLFVDGIDFELDGKTVNIKFVLGLIIGDNLALNGILDYIIGFRGNFYCRICRLSRVEAEQLCEELMSELRNRDNYENDVLRNDPSKTGVENNSMFNVLPYFHCTLNLCLDLMHDFFEGIFQYDICQAILFFIKKRYFTLNELNERISNFAYGKEDIRYIPNILLKKNLEENNLKMTSREAWQFLYLLPIYIGDKVNTNDEVWKLIKTLLELIELLLGSSFNQGSLTKLSTLIKLHNEIYIKYFGVLKPKMHLITHLPSSIKAMGPPRHYMAMRMEMMHTFYKVYAHCTPNRKNIAKSFCKKYSLYFANLLLNGKPILDIEYGSEIKTNFMDFVSSENKYFKSINYRGIDFKKGMYLPVMELGSLILYEILEIVISDSKTVSIICKSIGSLNYNSHILSFQLTRNLLDNEKLIPLNNFQSIPINIYIYNSNIEVIRPKNFFQLI